MGIGCMTELFEKLSNLKEQEKRLQALLDSSSFDEMEEYEDLLIKNHHQQTKLKIEYAYKRFAMASV